MLCRLALSAEYMHGMGKKRKRKKRGKKELHCVNTRSNIVVGPYHKTLFYTL